jgi:hypothetical protein
MAKQALLPTEAYLLLLDVQSELSNLFIPTAVLSPDSPACADYDETFAAKTAAG